MRSISKFVIVTFDFAFRPSWQEQLSEVNGRPANFKSEQNIDAAEAAQF